SSTVGTYTPRQIAGSEQSCKIDGIAPVGLHLVAGLLGNQRRRDDLTAEPLAGQVAMQPVTAWAGLVREHEVRRLRLQTPNQFIEIRLSGPDGPDEHGRIGALALRVGHRDRIFVDVETDENRSRLC